MLILCFEDGWCSPQGDRVCFNNLTLLGLRILDIEFGQHFELSIGWEFRRITERRSLQLRKQNEELVKEVDHIQEGRCSDVYKVAYLKWINACLRYELRNYRPSLGETTARNLSKMLSPKSTKEDQGDRGIHVLELDSNKLSSQEPHLMNSAHKIDTSHKSKIFRNLMRLIRGKDHHHNHSEMVHNTEENAARCSCYSSGYCSDMSVVDTGAIRPQSRSRTPSPGSSKQFIDFHSFDQGSTTNKGESKNYPTHTRRYSVVGSLDYMSKRLAESPQEQGNNHDQENFHKAELAKYAEVLKGSPSKEPVRKRSACQLDFIYEVCFNYPRQCSCTMLCLNNLRESPSMCLVLRDLIGKHSRSNFRLGVEVVLGSGLESIVGVSDLYFEVRSCIECRGWVLIRNSDRSSDVRSRVRVSALNLRSCVGVGS
ncbi:hypothetical protein H5410_052450 [Solanum commersonii]|uniref:Uncharacterized protein n=1 Tax=Solanum commersonii TaxID=4109 RepID=A0A9J5X286_SOLCO|nr:hypothetical protein H5410_052450 [Solanum commersonii]